MKLDKFKENNKKKISIIVFTIVCVLLVSGVILYRTFAMFEVNTSQNIIFGNIGKMEDLEFLFYKDDEITKNVPNEDGYIFDSSKSYCMDRSTGSQVGNVSWNSKTNSASLDNIAGAGKIKCYLHFNKIYQEGELNGAIPDFGNGRLVPITLNETGQAVKADITGEWYSYVDKEWANAVILRDGLKDNYKPGTVINENDIESYFVWIPRFEYKIFNDELYDENDSVAEPNPQEIQIKFVTKEGAIQYGMNKDEWLTHPAFTAFDVNGFWVGKFETSKSISVEDNSISPEAIQIKPGVSSWRNIQVSKVFYTSYKYQRSLDSHAIKNTEWGAIAYLSHSKYGYIGNIEVNRNPNHFTGYSGTNNAWNTQEGQKASTTQNITGVYDMSGGAWEYAMGVMKTEKNEYITGENETNNSGFVGIFGSPKDGEKQRLTEEDGGLLWMEDRYYDFYKYSTTTWNYKNRILGDATGETGPFNNHRNNWYLSHSFFVYNGAPWFIRGGGIDVMIGTDTFSIFAFSNSHGKKDIMTFRVVLTP